MTTFTGFHVSSNFPLDGVSQIIERLTTGTATNIQFFCSSSDGGAWLGNPSADDLVRRDSVYDFHVIISVRFDYVDEAKIAVALLELGHDGLPHTELRTCAGVG